VKPLLEINVLRKCCFTWKAKVFKQANWKEKTKS